jgi:hypothetical protein
VKSSNVLSSTADALNLWSGFRDCKEINEINHHTFTRKSPFRRRMFDVRGYRLQVFCPRLSSEIRTSMADKHNCRTFSIVLGEPNALLRAGILKRTFSYVQSHNGQFSPSRQELRRTSAILESRTGPAHSTKLTLVPAQTAVRMRDRPVFGEKGLRSQGIDGKGVVRYFSRRAGAEKSDCLSQSIGQSTAPNDL